MRLMSTSPTGDSERSGLFKGFGVGSVTISADDHNVVVEANADGLVGLAHLLLQLACSSDTRTDAHLLPTLQVSPESLGLRIALIEKGPLPDGRSAPSWEERLAGWG